MHLCRCSKCTLFYQHRLIMSSESVFNCRDAAVHRCAAAGGNATAISATCKAAHSRRVPWEPWASRPFPGAFHFCRPASATLAYPKKKEKKTVLFLTAESVRRIKPLFLTKKKLKQVAVCGVGCWVVWIVTRSVLGHGVCTCSDHFPLVALSLGTKYREPNIESKLSKTEPKLPKPKYSVPISVPSFQEPNYRGKYRNRTEFTEFTELTEFT